MMGRLSSFCALWKAFQLRQWSLCCWSRRPYYSNGRSPRFCGFVTGSRTALKLLGPYVLGWFGNIASRLVLPDATGYVGLHHGISSYSLRKSQVPWWNSWRVYMLMPFDKVLHCFISSKQVDAWCTGSNQRKTILGIARWSCDFVILANAVDKFPGLGTSKLMVSCVTIKNVAAIYLEKDVSSLLRHITAGAGNRLLTPLFPCGSIVCALSVK